MKYLSIEITTFHLYHVCDRQTDRQTLNQSIV